MRWQLIVLNILELSACITGFLYWKKIKNSFWRWFPVYLGVIFLTEITGEYFLYELHDLETNIAIYSYFGIPLQFFFLYWLFYQHFKNTKNSKWPLLSAAIYSFCWLGDTFFFDMLFDSFSYTIGCTLLLILLLIYFIKFLNSRQLLSYKFSMMFWVCLGVLIFYIGALPFFGLRTVYYSQFPEFFYVYWYVQFVLNYLMYISFCISFIWGQPK